MYGVSGKGYVLSDYVIVSNIVATILVVAVTIQVNNETKNFLMSTIGERLSSPKSTVYRC